MQLLVNHNIYLKPKLYKNMRIFPIFDIEMILINLIELNYIIYYKNSQQQNKYISYNEIYFNNLLIIN